MKKKSILRYIFFSLVVCCACNNTTKKTYTVILPIDSVASIVADCYFLESEIYVKQWDFDKSDYSLTKYDAFFNKHKITRESFADNVRYYITSEKHADKFIDKVDALIEQRVAILKDSLNLE